MSPPNLGSSGANILVVPEDVTGLLEAVADILVVPEDVAGLLVSGLLVPGVVPASDSVSDMISIE